MASTSTSSRSNSGNSVSGGSGETVDVQSMVVGLQGGQTVPNWTLAILDPHNVAIVNLFMSNRDQSNQKILEGVATTFIVLDALVDCGMIEKAMNTFSDMRSKVEVIGSRMWSELRNSENLKAKYAYYLALEAFRNGMSVVTAVADALNYCKVSMKCLESSKCESFQENLKFLLTHYERGKDMARFLDQLREKFQQDMKKEKNKEERNKKVDLFVAYEVVAWNELARACDCFAMIEKTTHVRNRELKAQIFYDLALMAVCSSSHVRNSNTALKFVGLAVRETTPISVKDAAVYHEGGTTMSKAILLRAQIYKRFGFYDLALMDFNTYRKIPSHANDANVDGDIFEMMQLLNLVAVAHDAYQILGVERTAKTKDIRHAYKRKALDTHPDKTTDEKRKKVKEAEFCVLNSAYKMLINPSEKSKYDQNVKVQALAKMKTNELEIRCELERKAKRSTTDEALSEFLGTLEQVEQPPAV